MKKLLMLLLVSVLLAACGGNGAGGEDGAVNAAVLSDSGQKANAPGTSQSQGRDPATNARGPATFYDAKVLLRERVFNTPALRKTLYCGCSYGADGAVDHLSCGFQPRLNKQGVLSDQDRMRAERMEFDHIVPASFIGAWRGCWKDGKRKGCEADDPVYNRIAADLVNLRPTIGQVNRDRFNYLFGIIPGEARVYGACDMEVDFKAHIAEPPPEVRGDIARIVLYMRDRYGITFGTDFLTRMVQWSSRDPASTEECELNQIIASVQGRGNPFVSSECATGAVATIPALPPVTVRPTPVVSAPASSNRECGTKKYCSQMSSCSEARFYLQCGVTRLDGDKDGVPCESLCN